MESLPVDIINIIVKLVPKHYHKILNRINKRYNKIIKIEKLDTNTEWLYLDKILSGASLSMIKWLYEVSETYQGRVDKEALYTIFPRLAEDPDDLIKEKINWLVSIDPGNECSTTIEAHRTFSVRNLDYHHRQMPNTRDYRPIAEYFRNICATKGFNIFTPKPILMSTHSS